MTGRIDVVLLLKKKKEQMLDGHSIIKQHIKEKKIEMGSTAGNWS